MASAWGKAFGVSWASSWGAIAPSEKQLSSQGGSGKESTFDNTKHKKILRDDEICLQLIIQCATIITGDIYGINTTNGYTMQMREITR